MNRRPLLLLLRYGLAVALPAVAICVNFFIPDLNDTPEVLFLAAVATVVWYSGLVPGLLATAVAVLALDYFFIPEYHTVDFGPATWIDLSVFVVVAVLISFLTEIQRRLNLVLQQQNRRKTEFMAVLGHELRNFLGPVSNAATVIRLRGTNDPAVEQASDVIDRQLLNMTRLIDDILDTARINQGKIELALAAVDARTIVARALESTRHLIESRCHRMETQLPPGPLPLYGDATRLEQVLINLLTNAAKYTEPGGRIWLSVERGEREIVIRVRDTGRGISAETLPHVFELFRQDKSGFDGGLGIGLSLVRGLVELHGGTVKAFSDGTGRGSEFIVRLPSAEPEEAKPKQMGVAHNR
ncbi:MAG: ATP-binding protein [Sulfurifustis sp.]